MHKALFRVLILAISTSVAAAQTTASDKPSTQPQTQAPTPPATSNFTSAKGFVLEDGTPIKLRLNRNLSSADAHTGDTVDFDVVEDVTLNGTLIVPKGGLALATVTEAQSKRRMARGGKLDVNIDYVKLLDSERAPLRAVKEVKGGGHTGVMTGGIVATGIVFFPAAPFFLFMHGKDITIPKGTEITAYVSGDMKLEIAKFHAAADSHANAAMSASARIQLDSNPSGADIEIDGSFVGNAPSELQVAEGEHTITVKKAGFGNWEKKVKVSGGSIVHLNAELEKSSAQ